MLQEKIKHKYKVELTQDFEEVLDSLQKELKTNKGVVEFFSLKEDDIVTKELPFEELKKQAIEARDKEECPTIKFENVEVICHENQIDILSKIELKLKGIDFEEE